MVNVEFVREMDFSADEVWAVLSDFGEMGWTGAPEVEVIGEGIGMIRRVIMEGMDPIDEVLEKMDHGNKTLVYTIPRGLPLPVTDYRAGGRVEDREGGGAKITWFCTCTPTDENMSVDDVQNLLKDTYAGLLDGLEAHLQAA